MNLVCDLLEEFIKDGITKIFILNAHFENEAFILESVDLVSQKHPEVTIIESNWWDVLSQDTIDKVFSEVAFPGWAFEHAAITETSLMMYLAPVLPQKSADALLTLGCLGLVQPKRRFNCPQDSPGRQLRGGDHNVECLLFDFFLQFHHHPLPPASAQPRRSRRVRRTQKMRNR